ncbi:MAG: hypoxanthine-guanine phosphoribosyltransferase [Gammaproteobacteria bacterium]|nr:hypoxanthine-guanine phosphoribosyltransferase [Gammaproteobacteria bacterium]MBU1623702.1 hypoxanthine-guanine phosphoribosyltransferase [Gammaproteobacteria bacterium]
MMTDQRAREILAAADMLHDADEVQSALYRVAQQINTKLAGQHPLVLSVMGGAVVFSGQLLPLLTFPLDFDYLHVSRYGNEKQGGQLHWKVAPRENVKGKVVLVLDDILDEGETMHAIKQRVLELGATAFYSAVFTDKDNGKDKPIRADFVGLTLPNRFVFGYGMDIHGAWRNLPAIYAVKED